MTPTRFEHSVPTSVKRFAQTLPSLWQGGRAAFRLVYYQRKTKMLTFVSGKSSYLLLWLLKQMCCTLKMSQHKNKSYVIYLLKLQWSLAIMRFTLCGLAVSWILHFFVYRVLYLTGWGGFTLGAVHLHPSVRTDFLQQRGVGQKSVWTSGESPKQFHVVIII